MKDQDTIFEQFKNAAQKAEMKDFPEMEKIWSRIDAKMDTIVYKRQKNNWKKLVVAASVVIVGIMVYQFFKTNDTLQIPENKIVISDTLKPIIPKIMELQKQTETTINKNFISNAETEKLIKNQIKNEKGVAVLNNNNAIHIEYEEKNSNALIDTVKDRSYKNFDTDIRKPVYEARTVQHKAPVFEANSVVKSESQVERGSDLLIVNGKLTDANDKLKTALVDDTNNTEQTIVHLKEPLYIIDGKYYSETEMYGKNPTSPYAPLDFKEIKTIKILQDQEAVAIYGKKGEKGVVIITTKTGKPKVPK